jgi:hypothetical protein
MTYTIAGGKYFNTVLTHPEDADPSSWSQTNVIEDMKKHFEGWDPRYASLSTYSLTNIVILIFSLQFGAVANANTV